MAEYSNGRIVLHIKVGLQKLIESGQVKCINTYKSQDLYVTSITLVDISGQSMTIAGSGKTILEAIENLNKEIFAQNFEL